MECMGRTHAVLACSRTLLEPTDIYSGWPGWLDGSLAVLAGTEVAMICPNCCTEVPHEGNTVGDGCGVIGKGAK
jgi:hypothetical protein